jgi:hypothetical protein
MKECILSAVAVLSIAGIVCYSLTLGHDGVIVQLGIGAIAGLAGYQVAKRSSNGKSNGGTGNSSNSNSNTVQ